MLARNQTENTAITSSYGNTNSKVGKLIRDIRDNVTQKGIVLLLLEIAERPDVCLDFEVDLPEYLNMFLRCPDDVLLTEASHLILSAAKIYSRRVDYIHECIQQIISGMDRSIKDAEDSKRKTSPVKQKRAIKRPRMEQDSLYEAEMTPKQLKSVPFAKTTEALSSASTFEAPKNFFRQWNKYKEWRSQYKRKLKCPVPYSTLHDNLVLHPTLWKLSCIEDFDYEDDIDTKRNYKVFTNHIEHRQCTLVNDINFIMHFKVKDFIEAEEDEIEIMNILGLPPPPKRKWPPICKSFGLEDRRSDVSSEDYLNNYLELENALIESENCDSSRKSQPNAAQELILKFQNTLKMNCVKETVRSIVPSARVEVLVDDTRSFQTNGSGGRRIANDSIQASVEGIANLPENHPSEKDVNASHEQNEEAASNKRDANLQHAISFQENVENTVSEERAVVENMKCAIISKTTTDSVQKSLSLPTNGNEKNKSVEGSGKESSLEVNSPRLLTNGIDKSKDSCIETTNTSSLETNSLGMSADGNVSIEASGIETTNRSSLEANSLSLSTNDTERNQTTEGSGIESSLEVNSLSLPPNGTAEISVIETTNTNSLEIAKIQNLADYEKFLNTANSDNFLKDGDLLDNNNIIIRLSVDEGVALSDLDEIDRAMLSPVVEIVDILKPIISKVPSPTDLVFNAGQTHNFLEIDQSLLTFRQDFALPFDVLLQPPKIKQNLLKIPERILKKTSFFKLPADFNAFKRDRHKRKKEVTPNGGTKLKLHKLNDGSIKNNFLTPPPSPVSEDFFGFGDSLLDGGSIDGIGEGNCESKENSGLAQEETAGAKTSRSFSRDSGIGISATDINPQSATAEGDSEMDHLLDALILSQSQEDKRNSYLEDPIFHSTIINGAGDALSSTLNNENEGCWDAARNCSVDLSSSDRDGSTVPEPDGEQPVDSRVTNSSGDLNSIIEKVQKWHRYLKPILQQSKDRHHFDVFAIGTEIINQFAETAPGEAVTFEDVMREKDPSYISRYFLSSLLLANQNNISLQVLGTNKEDPVAPNNIQLTLQSKQRHNVSIEDDIGATHVKKRKTSVAEKQTPQPIAQKSTGAKPSDPCMQEDLLFFKRNDEKIFEILRKYRETNREMLIKEIEENRDDYIRVLSQKHDIDLGLYFSENELQRLRTETVRRNFENECLIYPKSINIRQNKTRTVDDVDSGFHSHNTTEPQSDVL